MHRLALALAALLACEQAHAQAVHRPARREIALMNAIEKRVELPPGAASMWVYFRRYAYADNGTVVGVYINQTIADRYIEHTEGVPDSGWLAPSRLPRISGGGCDVVMVFYDPAKKAPPQTTCNPPY